MNLNTTINQFVDSAWSRAKTASSCYELRDIAQAMVNYGAPIRYNFMPWYRVIAGLAIAAALFAFLGSNSMAYREALSEFSDWLHLNVDAVVLAPPATLAVTAFLGWLATIHFDRKISRLSQMMFQKYAEFHYGLIPVCGQSLVPKVRALHEMQRGNHRRELEDCFKGRYQGKDLEFEYIAYRFHFVDRSEYRDEKGRKKWSYRHYYRSGLLVSFPRKDALQVVRELNAGRYSESFQPSSTEFNGLFRAFANQQVVLSRFLSPIVVDRLTRAASAVPGLELEVSSEGLLCLASSADHIIGTGTPIDHNPEADPRINPQAFYNALTESAVMPVLDEALDLAHELIRFNDSNF